MKFETENCVNRNIKFLTLPKLWFLYYSLHLLFETIQYKHCNGAFNILNTRTTVAVMVAVVNKVHHRLPNILKDSMLKFDSATIQRQQSPKHVH